MGCFSLLMGWVWELLINSSDLCGLGLLLGKLFSLVGIPTNGNELSRSNSKVCYGSEMGMGFGLDFGLGFWAGILGWDFGLDFGLDFGDYFFLFKFEEELFVGYSSNLKNRDFGVSCFH